MSAPRGGEERADAPIRTAAPDEWDAVLAVDTGAAPVAHELGGAAAAGDGLTVGLVLNEDDEMFAYVLPVEEARALSAALEAALDEVARHPPRESARGVGWVDAAPSGGATHRVGV